MVNFMFGVILLILIFDGSFVIFFNVVCVDMYFLICFCVFREFVIILKFCRMLRCVILSNYLKKIIS